MGTVPNQQRLRQLAAQEQIPVIPREKSYTSKASLADMDEIPVYRKGDTPAYIFSGKRIKRGLYRTKDGLLINADLNGVGNVIRKEYPYAFDLVTDWTYLTETVQIVTRAELCHAKKEPGNTGYGKNRSSSRRYRHEVRWNRKHQYMELFGVTKKNSTAYKKQPAEAA